MKNRPIFENSRRHFADELLFNRLGEIQAGIDYASKDEFEQGKATKMNSIITTYNDYHADESEGYAFSGLEFEQYIDQQLALTDRKTEDKFFAGQREVLIEAKAGVTESSFFYDPAKDPIFDGNYRQKDVIGMQTISDDLDALITQAEEKVKNDHVKNKY